MVSRVACYVIVLAFAAACMRDYDGLFAHAAAVDANANDAGGSTDDGASNGGSSGNPTGECTNTAPRVIAKCSEGELGRSIHTDPADPRVIVVPNSDEDAPYVPNCMTIRAGQSVTWKGKLSAHPLIQREDSMLPNPIQTVTRGMEAVVRFDCPGDYNFSCRNHRDDMLGTIRVLP